jgi:hypothetical protein
MKFAVALLCVPLVSVHAFGIIGGLNSRAMTNTALNYAATEMETMKLRDIKDELKGLGVPFGDCFDRDSLLCRLRDAREGKIETKTADDGDGKEEGNGDTSSAAPAKPMIELDTDSIIKDLRSQPLNELKLQCSKRNLRYFSFLEREDFVQAIWKDMQAVASFSVSGALRPGKVSDITGEELDQEMTAHETPILLDVYASKFE